MASLRYSSSTAAMEEVRLLQRGLSRDGPNTRVPNGSCHAGAGDCCASIDTWCALPVGCAIYEAAAGPSLCPTGKFKFVSVSVTLFHGITFALTRSPSL